MAKPDYFAALNDIAAPVRGGEQSGFAAATATGAAAVAGIEKTTDAVKFLGTTALEGVVGYKQAGLQKEIDATLNNTVAGSYVGKDAQDKLNVFNAQRADAMSQLQGKYIVDSKANEAIVDNTAFEAADASVLSEYNAEVAKLRAGQLQGVYSRDQAINRIAALVKSYSADVPGLAQSFRQIAAEQTGISNIDVLGVHNALTKQSEAEKLRIKSAETDMALAKRAAEFYNYTSLKQLTPSDLESFKAFAAFKNKAELVDNMLKSRKLDEDSTDKANRVVVAAAGLDSMRDIQLGLDSFFARVGTATTPDQAIRSQQAGTELEALISKQETAITMKIMAAMNNPNNPWPGGDAVLKQWQGIFKQYREDTKSAEGRANFYEIVKSSKGNYELMMSNFWNNHQVAAVMKDTGMLPELLKVAAAQGFDRKKMETQFGAAGVVVNDLVLDLLSKDPSGASAGVKRMLDGKNPATESDPRQRTLNMQTAREEVTKAFNTGVLYPAGKEGDTIKKSMYNATMALANNFDPENTEWWNTYRQLMGNTTNAGRYLGQFSQEERNNIVGTFQTKIESATFKIGANIKALQDNFKAEAAKASLIPGVEDTGVRMRVIQDPTTGALKAETYYDKPALAAYVSAVRAEEQKRGVRIGPPPVAGGGQTREQLDQLLAPIPTDQMRQINGELGKVNAFAATASNNAQYFEKKLPLQEAYGVAKKIVDGQSVRFFSIADKLEPTAPTTTPQRRASDRVSTKTTPAERDRPQILADELAFSQRRLDALKNNPSDVSPKRTNETDAAWKERIASDIARANADVLALTGELKAVTK
jgi:hypothetical protein